MALKPCRECGEDVSEKAASCPNCGINSPARKPTGFLGALGKAFVYVATLFLIIVFVSIIGHRTNGGAGQEAVPRAAVEQLDVSELRAALLNERKQILSSHPDADLGILGLVSNKLMPYIDACEKQLEAQGKSSREATDECMDDDAEMREQLRFAARFPAAPAEYLDAVKALSEFAACERRLFLDNLSELPVAWNPTASPENQIPARAVNVPDDVVAQSCNKTTSGDYMRACTRLHRAKAESQQEAVNFCSGSMMRWTACIRGEISRMVGPGPRGQYVDCVDNAHYP